MIMPENKAFVSVLKKIPGNDLWRGREL